MARPGTARRGQRVALLAEPPAPASKVIAYVCGPKPLPFGAHVLPAGVEIPGAADWLRREAWVDARRIRPVLEGEAFISYEEFTGMTYEDELVALEVAKAQELARAAAEADTAEADTAEADTAEE